MSGLGPQALADRIRALQHRDGRIDWIDGGLWDPWNHCEAAMGLMVADDIPAARRAMAHLSDVQRSDGSWIADMGCAAPMDADNRRMLTDNPAQVVDTNFCAYPAVGAWRLALTTGEIADLQTGAALAERALRFVISLQRRDGAFPWRAPEGDETPEDVEPLLAGGTSILFSLRCGARLLAAARRPSAWIARAAQRLRQALDAQPEIFADRSRYAMDWYYPVLTGLLPVEAGRARLHARWSQFVHPHWGCRCVRDEPWATAAETAELALAAAAVGARRIARDLLDAVARHDDGHGGLWMGRQFVEDRPWPEERPSWTAGAALMAWDAVERRTSAARLFDVQSAPAAKAEPAPSAAVSPPA